MNTDNSISPSSPVGVSVQTDAGKLPVATETPRQRRRRLERERWHRNKAAKSPLFLKKKQWQKQYGAEYRVLNATHKRATDLEWLNKNRARHRATSKAWKAAHPDQHRATMKVVLHRRRARKHEMLLLNNKSHDRVN